VNSFFKAPVSTDVAGIVGFVVFVAATMVILKKTGIAAKIGA